MPSDVARKVHASIESVLRGEREEFALEYPSTRRGEDRWLEIRVRRLERPGGGATVMHFDMTARRQAEAASQQHLGHIAHLDRVAAMGQLAASLAHELNQPLTAITNAQAAKRMIGNGRPDMAEVHAVITDIIADDQRAAAVIRHMRRLLKKIDFTHLPLDLNELTTNTIALVANGALLHSVSLGFRPATPLPVAYGDLVQIQQVVLNLLTNAIAAASIGSRPTRKVTVWTAPTRGPYVELGVQDSGDGIKKEDLERRSSRSSPPSPTGSAWVWRSAARSSKRMAAFCWPRTGRTAARSSAVHLRTDATRTT
jgi:C4-dicarboxylate-specific signal transduction histidine kinase